MRKNDLKLRSWLIGGGCSVAIIAITAIRFSEAQSRPTLAAPPPAAAAGEAVSSELRRALAGTCAGYNLELEHAAGIAQRIGKAEEAQRLLGMRQSCQGSAGTQQANAQQAPRPAR
jgi:hypothetical protein